MKHLLVLLALCFTFITSFGQQKVTYKAVDGLQVTADLYLGKPNSPFIILLHQAGYSRGEFREIAPRLINLGYSCLAVDLRSGKEVNFIENETAKRGREQNVSANYIDAIPDILASIDYARALVQKPVILFGSSYSASLCLLVASESVKVGGVISCSPGEYFGDSTFVKNRIILPKKPVFVCGSKREMPEIKKLVSNIPIKNLVVADPGEFSGTHGASTFWSSKPESKEMWLALTLFFSRLPK